MRNYRQNGDTVYVVAPTGGMVAGRAYVFGVMIGVSPVDADAGETVALWLKGCFALPKASATNGSAFTVGEACYWDVSENKVVAAATGNVKLGVCSKAAASLDDEVEVRLNGSF